MICNRRLLHPPPSLSSNPSPPAFPLPSLPLTSSLLLLSPAPVYEAAKKKKKGGGAGEGGGMSLLSFRGSWSQPVPLRRRPCVKLVPAFASRDAGGWGRTVKREHPKSSRRLSDLTYNLQSRASHPRHGHLLYLFRFFPFPRHFEKIKTKVEFDRGHYCQFYATLL